MSSIKVVIWDKINNAPVDSENGELFIAADGIVYKVEGDCANGGGDAWLAKTDVSAIYEVALVVDDTDKLTINHYDYRARAVHKHGVPTLVKHQTNDDNWLNERVHTVMEPIMNRIYDRVNKDLPLGWILSMHRKPESPDVPTVVVYNENDPYTEFPIDINIAGLYKYMVIPKFDYVEKMANEIIEAINKTGISAILLDGLCSRVTKKLPEGWIVRRSINNKGIEPTITLIVPSGYSDNLNYSGTEIDVMIPAQVIPTSILFTPDTEDYFVRIVNNVINNLCPDN